MLSQSNGNLTVATLAPMKHKSPAKIQRDQERSEHKDWIQIITQCQKIRDAPMLEEQQNADHYKAEEIKLIKTFAFHDQGYGNHPAIGEVVATMNSIILDESGSPIIQTGDVLQYRKINYIHPVLQF